MADQCSSCFFGQTRQSPAGASVRVCRHNSPLVINMASGPTTVLWAPVADTDWCGDGLDVTTKRAFTSAVPQIATVATLPPATQSRLVTMFVSDSIAPSGNYTIGSPVQGGGTYTMHVYSDGNIWRLG